MLTGISDGPDYFNISQDTGSIFVKTDLRTDLNRKFLYQLRVEASKTFTTGLKKASSVVNITVARNENAPTFAPERYTVTVPENLALGSSVVQLTASDVDTQVSYSFSFYLDMLYKNVLHV